MAKESDADILRKPITEESEVFQLIHKGLEAKKFGELWSAWKYLLAGMEQRDVRLDAACSFYFWEITKLMHDVVNCVTDEDSDKIQKFFDKRREDRRNADPAYQAMRSLQETMQHVMAPEENEEEEMKH